MKTLWFTNSSQTCDKAVLRSLSCHTLEELEAVLDTIYDKVKVDLLLPDKPKPVVKFLPLIKRVETFNLTTGLVEAYEHDGSCLSNDCILIKVGRSMKYAIVHELVHWLQPSFTELETKRAAHQLIKLWQLRGKA